MNAVPKQSWVKVQYTQTQLGGGTTAQGVSYPGGLDLVTPTLRLQPGALHDGVNFEVAQFGGYSRIAGYERFDGRPSPSAATYTIVQVASFILTPMIGQTVTQTGSGATGIIAAVVTAPTPYIVLTQVTGIFDGTNSLSVATPIPMWDSFVWDAFTWDTAGSIVIGNATTLTVGINAKTKAIYTAAAADVYRAMIQKVPGSGPVRGVVAMAFAGVDHVYAFRDNVGATAELLYRATSTGWVLVPYYDIVSFTAGGTSEPFDGETLTQGGVTATIKRVVWQSGSWTGSAVGQFVVTTPAGGNFAAGAAHTTSGATVTLSGAQTAITMAAGGRFEFDKGNFSGQLITRRIYGCDGVNKCFEFDGDALVPISTGLTLDRPSHIRIHKNILFVSQDASLIYSAAGNPFKWSAVDGGGEIATGDTITGMLTLPGSQTTATLGVYLRTNTSFLYGTDPTTFNYVTFNSGIGAVPYSMQNLFDTFVLDDLGVITLKTTLNWGNFLPTTLTKNILPFIARERGNLVASSINREKSQYRLFFGDGYGLYATILNQQYLGCGLVLFPDVLSCVDTTNLITDDEATYAGSEAGYVFQLDVGTSFDGAIISAYIVTAWDQVKSPRILKRFRAASIEVQGDSYAEIQYGWQLGYSNAQIPQLPPTLQVLNLGGVPHWDQFVWDNFVWDGTGLIPTDVDETGTAENIRVTIASGTNYIAAYTVNSVIHQYSMRRGMRV